MFRQLWTVLPLVSKTTFPIIEDDVRAALQFLTTSTSPDLLALMSLWRTHNPKNWSAEIDVYRLLGERFIKLGEPLVAFDVVSEGLKNFPADLRLRQLSGLALSRSGASEVANVVLEKLCSEGCADEETLGMLARTHKDLAARVSEPYERQTHLRRAAEAYAQAYQLTGGYWTGINAATMSLIIGEEDNAKTIATKVYQQCLDAIKTNPSDPYWLYATLGEASLVLREIVQAEQWYEKASGFVGGRYGDVNSSRRNARLVLEYWNLNAPQIERWLKVPNVVVFAGHMLDQSLKRASPRFPAQIERTVAAEIRERLKKLDARFGYASAACGSDILFLEAMLDRGGEICVVLPYEKDQFLLESVSFAGEEWTIRLENVLAKATRVLTISSQKLEIGAVSYDYTNQFLLGLANIRARQMETKLAALAVWDGQPGDGQGGTDSAIKRWLNLGHEVEIIKLDSLDTKHLLKSVTTDHYSTKQPVNEDIESQPEFGSQVRAILFADAIGFSKLSEPQVPQFVKHFLGNIAQLISSSPCPPLSKNTWGDGLFFVFSSVTVAGQFALNLCSLATETKWEEYGLPKGLNIRIALHAGPVYECDDPITGQRTYHGTHVSRAARIEPITPPGQVYSSEAFAALAAIERSPGFGCLYVGQTPLAKGYGSFPTYHVRRS